MASYDTFKLEKGVYITGKGLARILEELDLPTGYGGTPLSGLDVYQRQLKRFGIRVGGPGSDPVERFFQISDSTALFPGYVSRAVRQGIERADPLSGIAATVMRTSSVDYCTITSGLLSQDRELLSVVEGAEIPRTMVETQGNLVRLYKCGHMLVTSYEALRFQKLDLFIATPQQIGAYITHAQLDNAADILLDGNGDGNPAPVMDMTGKFSY